MKKYTKPMRCPFCGEVLNQGERREYAVTLDEEENDVPCPLRPTWVCSCTDAKGDFWSESGAFYSPRDGVSHWGEVTSALNSFDRDFDNMIARERLLRKFRLGRFLLWLKHKMLSLRVFAWCVFTGRETKYPYIFRKKGGRH